MLFTIANKEELLNGLNGMLALTENCYCFMYSGTIAAGTEVLIANGMSPIVPSYRVIVSEKGDLGRVIDGDTKWTSSQVSLKNVGLEDSIVAVIFLYDRTFEQLKRRI